MYFIFIGNLIFPFENCCLVFQFHKELILYERCGNLYFPWISHVTNFNLLTMYLIISMKEFSLINYENNSIWKIKRGKHKHSTMHWLPISGENSKLLCPLHLAIVSPKKPQLSLALDGTWLHYIEKRQNALRSALIVGFGPPCPRGLFFLAAHAAQFAYMHPSCAAMEGPRPLCLEDRHSSGVGQVSYDALAWAEQKGTHWTWNRKRYTHTC